MTLLFGLILLVPIGLLALQGVKRGETLSALALHFLCNLSRLVFGVLVPMFYFFCSVALAPDWKGAALSPMSCLIETKIWLTPLAAWAWVSFYYFVIMRPTHVKPWVILGLFTGAMGSVGCVVTALFLKVEYSHLWTLEFCVLVTPLVYVPVWYGLSAYQAHQLQPVRPLLWLLTGAAQAIGWLWAVRAAEAAYTALPTTAPDCYVVTASSYGYPWLVKPTIRFNQSGQREVESKQLLRFRAFERAWSRRYPRSHTHFRCMYDVVGPKVARRIRTPLRASLCYLGLKPFEFIACAVLMVLGLPYVKSSEEG